MLEVTDVGLAEITKREKVRQHRGAILDDDVPSGQDAHMIDMELSCFAVADGVGASPGSEIAAQAACDAYRDTTKARYIRESNEGMNDRDMAQAMLDKIHTAALGALALTTFTGLTIHPNGTATYLHVGDSQLLLLRGGVLTHITSEHVHEDGVHLYNYLGTMPDWAAQGYGRHSAPLTVSANSFSETKLEAEWGELRLVDGDRFALLTDGVTGSADATRLSDALIRRVLDPRQSAQASADTLLAESVKEDDSKLIVVHIGRRSDLWSPVSVKPLYLPLD